MENRKSRIQPTETLAGKYRACMQLEWKGTEESLSDGADSWFHKTTLWVLLLERKWNSKIHFNSENFIDKFKLSIHN